MEFRLVYKGPLPSETTKPQTEHKRRIRRYLHEQLYELWTQHPRVRVMGRFDTQPGAGPLPPFIMEIADSHKVVSKNNHIHSFVPLIGNYSFTSCSLDILFLRRDGPGGLVKHGGDLDNRIKVLLDALRMPRETQEVEDNPPDQDPLFCLLEDDRYIDQVSITTDRLLQPKESAEGIHEVMLVIGVKTIIFNKRADVAFW